ncbi:MAG: hypothetical protein LBG21_07000 [Campylobacteraceae bacterium]|jgi:hypothetical protein|nr:hypothetical protein [Campylobacteraceae bacterium]
MAMLLVIRFKSISLSKLKILFFSLFLGFFLVGCGEAQVPEITVQPKSKLATSNNQYTLQVTAQVTDGGILTYQWFNNTENSIEGGTAIDGANSDVFTFIAPLEGFAYYYVVVTNINANLTSYVSVVSDVAVITAVDYDVFEVSFYDESLKLLNTEIVRSEEVINPSKLQKGSWYTAGSSEDITNLAVYDNIALFNTPNVISISDRAGLEAIRYNLDGRYILESDIDLSGAYWTPIGDTDNPFTGALSGTFSKLHKITGLSIDSPYTDYVGLFGYVNSGHITALRLEDSNIKGGRYVGTVAGYLSLGTITSVCVDKGDVEGNNYVGIITGDVDHSTITTSCNEIISAGYDGVGATTIKDSEIIGDIYSVDNIEADKSKSQSLLDSTSTKSVINTILYPFKVAIMVLFAYLVAIWDTLIYAGW